MEKDNETWSLLPPSKCVGLFFAFFRFGRSVAMLHNIRILGTRQLRMVASWNVVPSKNVFCTWSQPVFKCRIKPHRCTLANTAPSA